VSVSVQYHFSARFRLPAKKAYEWCTNFDLSDHALMGEENAQRKITYITGNTIILTDTFHTQSGDVEKQKLVQLYSDQMFWTSTHLTGPNQFSQFLYRISAEGDAASRLEFTANHLEYLKENSNKAGIKQLAEKLCKEDSDAWKLLAKAMAKTFGK
jgi:hypothetical protein